MTAFDRILDVVMPDKAGIVAMLEAYFDESERPTGIFAVAGYAFVREQAKKFSKEWTSLFQPYGGACHMKQLAARRKPFDGIDDLEADRLMRGAVRLINKRASFGVAVSCHVAEMDYYLPKWVKGFEHAYPVCCHMAASMMGKQVKASSQDGSVAYFFEAGHRFAPSANFLMHYAEVNEEMRAYYRYRAHAFLKKQDATPLQAADMLAWEWAKYRDETVQQRNRTMRKSLAALFAIPGTAELDKSRYHITHLEGAALHRFCQGIAKLAVPDVATAALVSSGQPS